MYNSDMLIKILKEELVPALGCTEPIAIAYVSARAREVLGEMPTRVVIEVSGNVLKNVKSVGVPNADGLCGVDAACIVGVLGGDSSLNLEVLKNVTKQQVNLARRLLRDGFCAIKHLDSNESLHIRVTASTLEHEAVVELKHGHTEIVLVSLDGKVLYQNAAKSDFLVDIDCTLKDIFDFANEVDLNLVCDVIKRQIECNYAICREGLKENYGQNIGKTLINIYGSEAKITARALAAAGSDARMSGCALPVVINSGSGNQGLTVSIPVLEFARESKADEETTYRALILSNLVAIHLKQGMGKLSAFCGVVSASCGAGAGITYLFTKDFDMISRTITNTIANVSGIVCDGAKGSCAAKISSAVDACILAHFMTMSGNVFKGGDGIVKGDIEKTIQGVTRIGKDAMKETDKEILDIMFDDYKKK